MVVPVADISDSFAGALHHIKEHHNIPFDRLQALDQIGRAVVDKLVAEGKAAESGPESWRAWSVKLKNKLGLKKGKQSESEAYAGGLGQRLMVDDWASLMMGQEKHFRDGELPLFSSAEDRSLTLPLAARQTSILFRYQAASSTATCLCATCSTPYRSGRAFSSSTRRIWRRRHGCRRPFTGTVHHRLRRVVAG